jgi:hypothetical protein
VAGHGDYRLLQHCQLTKKEISSLLRRMLGFFKKKFQNFLCIYFTVSREVAEDIL